MKITKNQERILILIVIILFTLSLILTDKEEILSNVILEVKEENNSYSIRNVGDTKINVTIEKKETSWVPMGAAVLDINESTNVEKGNIKILGQQHD